MQARAILLLAIAALIAGIFLIPDKKGHSDAASNEETASGRKLTRLTSEQAREELLQVLDGTRKPPVPQDWEAWGRYYTATGEWISTLKMNDCLALLDHSETSGNSHSLEHKLYRRLGELNPEEALARIAVRIKDRSYGLSLQCDVLQGWGTVAPREAWNYFLSLDQGTLGHPLRATGESREIASEVFESWSKSNPAEAFESLNTAPPEDLPAASIGYYQGLPPTAEFEHEAANLEGFLSLNEEIPRALGHWTFVDWPPEYALPLMLASRWADQQPDKAVKWWLETDAKREQWDSEKEWEGDRIGLLVENWAGAYEVNNPDAALRWIESRSELLQSPQFQNRALPALAKHRPTAVIDLIREIESKDQQAFQLALLTRAPSFVGEDRYQRLEPSAILPPDLVEQGLSNFGFDQEQLQRVQSALKGRREYEATKPIFPPSGW